MSDILDGLMRDLGSDGVSAMASKLGMNSSQVQQAMLSALPLIVAAMSRNSNDPRGAQNLHNALQQHANDGTIQQQLQQITRQAAPDTDAAAILGHIFGKKQNAVVQGVSRSTGVDSGNAMNLMGMLAPLVMAYLGRQMQQKKMNASQVSNSLGQQATAMQGGGIGSLINAVLDHDGDGSTDLSAILSAGSGILGAFNRK